MNDIERGLRDLGDRTAQEVTYRDVPRGRIVRRARMRRGLVVAAPVAAIVLFAAVAYPRLGSDVERRVGVPVSVDLAAAAETTEREGSARIGVSMAMEFDGRTITMEGEGEVDFDDFRSYFRMTEEGDYAAFGDVEVITIGRLMFSRPIGESKWVKTKVDTPVGGSLFGADPDELFTYLESVSEEVTSLGEEVLDGVPVTHLRATIDTSALGEMPTTTGIEYEPFDVWIDDANRVRQMTFGGSFEQPGASNGTMSMTMRFWAFGVAVDVTAPPPEDVTDEPPASWGGPGGELIGSESSGGHEATGGIEQFGMESATYLTGPSGTDGPNVLLTSDQTGTGYACFNDLPLETTNVTVVHDESGREIVTTGADVPEETADTGYSGTCSTARIPKDDAEALVEDPTQFTLSLTMKDGSTEMVRLTGTIGVAGDTEE